MEQKGDKLILFTERKCKRLLWLEDKVAVR